MEGSKLIEELDLDQPDEQACIDYSRYEYYMEVTSMMTNMRNQVKQMRPLPNAVSGSKNQTMTENTPLVRPHEGRGFVR